MSEDVNPETIKATQVLLSKFIKKPPLTEKLLKKPPFRYLHDVITSIINETGFLKGLYTSEEMIVDNNLDKSLKIVFLDKLIAAVQIATNSNLSVKSSKIVSGLEVTKTHELLQAIGKAIENKVDSKKAVQDVLNNGVKKSNKNDGKSKSKQDKQPNSAKKAVGNDESPRSKTKPKEDTTKTLSPKSDERSENSSSAKENVQNNDQIQLKDNPETKEIENPIKPEEKSTSDQNVDTIEKIDATDVIQEPVVINHGENNSVRSERKSSSSSSSGNSTPRNRKTTPRSEHRKPRDMKQTTSSADKKLIDKENKKPSPREDKRSAERKTVTSHEKKSTPDKNQNIHQEKVIQSGNEDSKKPNSGKTESTRPDSQRNKLSAGKEKKDDKSKKEVEKRPSSARPGSRKPLKAPPSSSSQIPPQSNQSKETPVKRPPSAMKRPPSAGPRPPSARPGAPRVRERGEVVAAVETTVAPGPVNLIIEASKDKEEEEMVVVDSVAVENQRKQSLSLPGEEEQQGQLVHQILETQKEFESDSNDQNNPLKKTHIEWEGARRKGREKMGKELDKLKEWIQTVTKCAHPLGKLLDFFQEDIEEMQRELTMWRKKSSELKEALDIETENSKQSIEPLTLQLNELESKIVEETESVFMLKSKILKNDQRISTLLKSNSRISSGSR